MIIANILTVCIENNVANILGVIATRFALIASTRDRSARKNAASMSGGKSVVSVPVGEPLVFLGYPQIKTVVSELRPCGRKVSYSWPSDVDQKG